jgi:2-haloacid dehalogenase
VGAPGDAFRGSGDGLYLFDALGCRPEQLIHVSASIAYDHRPAADLGIGTRIWVNRGHEPPQPGIGYHEVGDLAAVPALLGIQPAATLPAG